MTSSVKSILSEPHPKETNSCITNQSNFSNDSLQLAIICNDKINLFVSKIASNMLVLYN